MVRLRDRPPPRQRTRWQRIRRKCARFITASYKLPKMGGGAHTDLPIRFRPFFVAATLLSMILLALLGFHPTLARRTRINDKLLHFIGLGLSTGLFYWIIEVENTSRRIWIWRWLPEILTISVCGIGGDIISEYVQSLLPYKSFQALDVVANLLGSATGLFVARQLARRERHKRELAELYQPLDEYGLAQSSDEESSSPITPNNLECGPEMAAINAKRPRSSRQRNDVWRDDSSSIFSLGDEEPDTEELEDETDAPSPQHGPSIIVERPSSEGPG